MPQKTRRPRTTKVNYLYTVNKSRLEHGFRHVRGLHRFHHFRVFASDSRISAIYNRKPVRTLSSFPPTHQGLLSKAIPKIASFSHEHFVTFLPFRMNSMSLFSQQQDPHVTKGCHAWATLIDGITRRPVSQWLTVGTSPVRLPKKKLNKFCRRGKRLFSLKRPHVIKVGTVYYPTAPNSG